MKGVIKIVVLFIITTCFWSCGEKETTVYHYPASFYRNNQLKVLQTSDDPYISKVQRDSQNITIGWHPYYLGESYNNYDFSLLHTVIFNGYEWRSDNTEEVIDAWYETSMVEKAREAGCKVFFSASNYGALRSKNFFDSTALQMDFIDEIMAYLKMKDADGVELDFPAILSSNEQDFTNFIKTFVIRLKQYDKDAELYLSLPFMDKNNAFNIREIQPYVNQFIIGGNNNANINYSLQHNEPIAPVQNPFDNDSASIAASLKHYSGKGINSSKMILELPYYTSIKRKVEEDGEVEYYNEFLSYEKFLKEYGEQEVYYDKRALSSYVLVDNPSTDSNDDKDLRVYFDDSTSLGAKYDWALSHGFGGVGIWSLGFDNGHTELWRMLENRSQYSPFAQSVASAPFSVGSYFGRYDGFFKIWFSSIVFLIFLAGFIAMLYWKSRDNLTSLRTFKIYFLVLGGFLIFWGLSIIGLLNNAILVTIIGLVFGVLLTYSLNGYYNRRIAREP